MPISGQASDITLIEALPFTNQVIPLTPAFQHATFPEIFRASKLTVDYNGHHDGAAVARNSDHNNTSFATSLMQALPQVPAAVKEGFPPHTATPTPIRPPAVSDKPAPKPADKVPFIYQNKYGQRVDRPISDAMFDQTLIQKLKLRKLCNKHWLGRGCRCFQSAQPIPH
jgi:hypothetical protein